MSRLIFFEQKNLEGARRALRVPALSPGWCGSFEERLDADGAVGA